MDEADLSRSHYAIHRLYWYLHFTHSPGTSEAGSPILEEPYTLPDVDQILTTALPTFPEAKRSQYGPLCIHPNASCAFASFPPSTFLNFHDSFGRVFLAVENPDGVTILDVNRALTGLCVSQCSRLDHSPLTRIAPCPQGGDGHEPPPVRIESLSGAPPHFRNVPESVCRSCSARPWLPRRS